MATTTLMATETALARNQRVFEREFLPLMDAVYTFALHLTQEREEAKDLVQETFSKVWRFLGHYAENTNAKAWVFRICRNAFINGYRSKARQPYKVDFEDLVVYHNEDEAMVQRYSELHQDMGSDMIGDEVTRAINALPSTFRMVVLLDLEDFTYEEIAAILGIPIGTVRSRLHRARHILAEKLRPYAEDQGYRVDEGSNASDDSLSS